MSDVKKVEKPVKFDDDFDELRARATSGGSLYGLLRRQAFLEGGRQKKLPAQRCVVRQRSKSLITKSVALPEEKSILKMLCEYAESSRRQTDMEQRRHSTACLEDARDANHINHLSPIRRLHERKHPQTETIAQVHEPPVMEEEGEEEVKGPVKSEPEVRFIDTVQTFHTDCDGLLSPISPNSVHANSILPAFPVGTPSMYRRRSFTVTPKGLVNQGDNFVEFQMVPYQACQASPSNNPYEVSFDIAGSDLHLLSKTSPTDSSASLGSSYSLDSTETIVYRVLMLGGPGVGKSALSQQFLTSEHMMAQNTSFDDGIECTVPVLLDGEETIVDFIDLPYTGEPRVWQEYEVECYIVVFSIIDRRTFTKAVDMLSDIRRDERMSSAILVLVANKTDLVRSRLVGEQEAKAAAQTYDCKYIEVSAILSHRVDELLVGVVKQLRNRNVPEKKKKSGGRIPFLRIGSGDTDCLSQCHQTALTAIPTLFASSLKFMSKSTDNLFPI